MTPNAVIQDAVARHPRTIVGVVLAFLGAITLTIGVTGNPVAALDDDGGDCSVVSGYVLSQDPYCDPCEDDPYCDPCEDDPYEDPYCNPTTTTTVPETTTTVEETTTTVEETTTTVEETTTTVEETTTTVEETTTTVEETTTTEAETTTTVDETTTTYEVEDSTTTSVEVAPPTTTGTGSNSPTTVLAELPKTGPGTSDTMLVLGALLLLVGGAMVLSTRRGHGIA